jgi:hypothetical protein
MQLLSAEQIRVTVAVWVVWLSFGFSYYGTHVVLYSSSIVVICSDFTCVRVCVCAFDWQD